MNETVSAPWKILIVDDEPEVHSVTKMVLGHYSYAGNQLLFLDAYSAAEAKPILMQHIDISRDPMLP